MRSSATIWANGERLTEQLRSEFVELLQRYPVPSHALFEKRRLSAAAPYPAGRWQEESEAKLVFMTLVRDERYLVDWLEFHLAVGVYHFYICDDMSESVTSAAETLRPYVERGWVSLYHCPILLSPARAHKILFFSVQRAFYQEMAEQIALDFAGRTEHLYFAKIDADDYLFPADVSVPLPSAAHAFLRDETVASITIPFKHFSANGLLETPTRGFLFEHFTARLANHREDIGKAISSFERCSLEDDMHARASQHRCVKQRNAARVNAIWVEPHMGIHLNHYSVGSFADWRLRMQSFHRGIHQIGLTRALITTEKGKLFVLQPPDTMQDTAILQYLPLLSRNSAIEEQDTVNISS